MQVVPPGDIFGESKEITSFIETIILPDIKSAPYDPGITRLRNNMHFARYALFKEYFDLF